MKVCCKNNHVAYICKRAGGKICAWFIDAFRRSERCILPDLCGDIFMVIKLRSSEFLQALLGKAAGRPFWLCGEGAQRLLSSQCRSCGAVSSYIWLLGLRWQPFFNRKNSAYKRMITWLHMLLLLSMLCNDRNLYLCLYLLAISLFVRLLASLEEFSNLSVGEENSLRDDCDPHG